MDSLFSAHVDGIRTELAAADCLIGLDLLTMSAEMLHLLFWSHGREHVRKLLNIPLMGKGCIAFRAWRQEIHAAEFCFFVILLQLDRPDVHLPKQGTDCVLNIPLFKRHPAILNCHLFTVIIREWKIRVLINHLPQELYLCIRVLFNDGSTVIANHNSRILCGQLLWSGTPCFHEVCLFPCQRPSQISVCVSLLIAHIKYYYESIQRLNT